MKRFLAAVVLCAFTAGTTFALDTIKDISSNPGKYNDTVVEVEGLVTRFVEVSGTTTTSFILQGESGQQIRVKTSGEKPILKSRYRVKGLVSIGAASRQPFIVEQSRELLAKSAAASSSEGDVAARLEPGLPIWMIGLIVIGGIVIVALIGAFAFGSADDDKKKAKAKPSGKAADMAKKGSDATKKLAKDGVGGDGSEGEPVGAGSPSHRLKSETSSSLAPSASSSGGPATLKFKAPPKTMKFIPGKLVVSAGPDQGKEFRIAGHPTDDGNVVTIGRAEVEGEKAFAHIHLGDTYRTVSRMQAEIIQREDNILLKNKSTTNPTVVNGDQLDPEQEVDMKDGDLIRMGELILKYECK